jgi:hypothetical protein
MQNYIESLGIIDHDLLLFSEQRSSALTADIHSLPEPGKPDFDW